MHAQTIELLAAYYTVSGDVYPSGPTQISPFSFRDRVEAIAEAGYVGIGLVHADLMATMDRIGWHEMRQVLRNNGIKYIEFEALVHWYKDGDVRRASDTVRSELFRAAQELGARAIKVRPGVGETHADMPLMIAQYAHLAEQASSHGTDVVLEIMPFSNVRTVDDALALVQGANHPHGKLLLDIWHMVRGGIAFDEIARIPARFIGAVELNDAEKYAVAPLWQDTIHRRHLPGDGVFDVPAFIRAVQSTGFDGPWSVEVLSERMRKWPLQDMAQRSYAAGMAQFT